MLDCGVRQTFSHGITSVAGVLVQLSRLTVGVRPTVIDQDFTVKGGSPYPGQTQWQSRQFFIRVRLVDTLNDIQDESNIDF